MPRYKRGSGSIYKRGRGWWLKYYVDGEPVREAARNSAGDSVRDSQGARNILKARLGEIAEGRYTGPAAEKISFDDLMAALLDDYKANFRRSYDDLERRVHKHLKPFFAGKRAHRISSADIQDFISKRRAEKASNGRSTVSLRP